MQSTPSPVHHREGDKNVGDELCPVPQPPFSISKANDCIWRKADFHAQQHLVVDKHELEMETIRIIRVELLCRVENWFVWIL